MVGEFRMSAEEADFAFAGQPITVVNKGDGQFIEVNCVKCNTIVCTVSLGGTVKFVYHPDILFHNEAEREKWTAFCAQRPLANLGLKACPVNLVVDGD